MTTPPPIVAGRVLGPSGQPVAQARVYFRQGPVPLPDLAALTDAQGSFMLAVPVAGTYQIGCTADGYAPATTTVQVPATSSQPVHVEINLKP
jgi:hypothetical protein